VCSSDLCMRCCHMPRMRQCPALLLPSCLALTFKCTLQHRSADACLPVPAPPPMQIRLPTTPWTACSLKRHSMRLSSWWVHPHPTWKACHPPTLVAQQRRARHRQWRQPWQQRQAGGRPAARLQQSAGRRRHRCRPPKRHRRLLTRCDEVCGLAGRHAILQTVVVLSAAGLACLVHHGCNSAVGHLHAAVELVAAIASAHDAMVAAVQMGCSDARVCGMCFECRFLPLLRPPHCRSLLGAVYVSSGRPTARVPGLQRLMTCSGLLWRVQPW